MEDFGIDMTLVSYSPHRAPWEKCWRVLHKYNGGRLRVEDGYVPYWQNTRGGWSNMLDCVEWALARCKEWNKLESKTPGVEGQRIVEHRIYFGSELEVSKQYGRGGL
jgi:hypothetical protein